MHILTYIYIHIYTCTHTHIYTYIHTQAHIYRYIYIITFEKKYRNINKKDHLCENYAQTKHSIGLCETFLNDDIVYNLVLKIGFRITRSHVQGRIGGDVCVYLKSNINTSLI